MLKEIVQPLIRWYQENKRTLPWRDQRNPYYTWISEIMLQQTRVEAVKPFFHRFVSALPAIEDVAVCEEDKLLKLWEGLGYYNRVRNIQKAAVVVKDQYGGQLPGDYDQLLKLPGIGEYTAGAIASIAFDIPVPAVDGNVLRVISRVIGSDEDIMKQSLRNQMRKDLLGIMPTQHPGDFNQALMELGATVCVPNGDPKCDICPLGNQCEANFQGIQMDIPVKTKAKARRIEERTILVIRDGERVAIRKRPSQGLLAGLYELPNYPGYLSEEEVLKQMEDDMFVTMRIQPIGEAKHIFSHVEWRMKGYLVKVAALEKEKNDDMLFVDIHHVEQKYPVPAAFQTYAAYMNMRLGQEKYAGGNL